jgi:hypothetical protein
VAEHIREVVSCTNNDDYFDCAAYDCDYYDYFDCADYYYDCADYHDYYFTCCGPCVGWVCWLFGWQVLGWF